ncbi:P-loop containing nucleoside triphosphate hydrolase protein [Hyaloraphidium curvatum]|nr:P-loop containing nucleoside triphosphate hydrolase protein [Hyaloraphidium curvatum]
MIARFATPTDRLLMLLGLVCAVAAGCAQPIQTIFLGDILQSLIQYNPACDAIPPPPFPYPCNSAYLRSSVQTAVIAYLIIAGVVFVLNYVAILTWSVAGERSSKRMREEYLAALLRQDVGWHDGQATGDLINRIGSDVNLVRDGISERIANITIFVSTFLCGFVLAFVRGWELAIVVSAILPILGGAGVFIAKAVQFKARGSQDEYGEAGGIAQAALSSIRTVVSFGLEETMIQKYEAVLQKALKSGVQQSLVSGVGLGFFGFCIFGAFALAFFWGSYLVEWGKYDGGRVINVFFSILIGAFSLSGMSPLVTAVFQAQGAAYSIFTTIDRKSPINYEDPGGKQLTTVEGNIEFRNVDFEYPTRNEVKVLQNFSLMISKGKTTALVGASGSGKSTIVKLVERFYDPSAGEVLLDGVSLKDLNVRWLRQQMAIVGQEPVLFDLSIKENILFGLDRPRERYTPEQLDAMVVAAAKAANAYDFIMRFEKNFDEVIGEKGGMVSGGQKQRIAIARAIISDPKILLLDESTSALDTASERIVQAALDSVSVGRTTIVVAHRLSTIKNADNIVVMTNGTIIEQGTHDELLARNGAYAELVKAQELKQLKKEERRIRRKSTADISKAHASHAETDSTELAKQKEEEEKERTKKLQDKYAKKSAPWGRLAKENAPEWYLIIIGTLGVSARIEPCTLALYALVFGNILTVFRPGNPQIRQEANFYSGLFVALGTANLFAAFMQTASFGISGERMTMRLRAASFRKMLYSEIAFFDEEENSAGSLVAKLSNEATEVKSLTGQLIGSLLQIIVTILCGAIIGLIYSWRLFLVIISVLPLLIAGSFLQFRTFSGTEGATKQRYERASKVASEAISEIRTVAPLTKEQVFLDMYKSNVAEPHRFAIRSAFIASAGSGFAQSFLYLLYALAFWYAGVLVLDGLSTGTDVQVAIFSVVFMTIPIGQASAFLPNVAKAKIAALDVFELLDRQSRINAASASGQKRDPKGQVDAKEIEFNYPTRPTVPVLRGTTLGAQPGETIACVGPSGAGKSTIIGLVLRFYDIISGRLTVEELEVRDWVLRNLRLEMALVGQEPVLFSMSIADNIAAGKPAELGPASRAEIEAAARQANIHNFVMKLPNGYDTTVGESGSLLSGGQKQRVAIARALIRQPKILLLDEATAALDSASEKVVQEALDAASSGRTTLVIAHRLSTIQGADRIFVFNEGRICESGKHMELLEKDGVYASLVRQQALTATAEE